MPIIGYKLYGRNIRPYLEEPEKKSRTILGMTLFSLVIFGAFAIRPSLFTISQLRQEVKEARQAQEILDQKINDLSQAQVNYQLAFNDLKLVDEALPTETSVPAILENLALAAGRNNITLDKTEFGKVENERPPETVALTVTVVGNLGNVTAFITELENGVRQTDVRQIKMTRGGKEPEQLTAEIKCATYFLEEEKNE